jgi:hypothetical protein
MVQAAGLSVHGKVSTANGPVRFALVTFVADNDTLRESTALTDSLGDYSIDLVTGIGESDFTRQSFTLNTNYPNPFSSHTFISYQLRHPSTVSLSIVNVLGQEIWNASFVQEFPGFHSMTWDGTDHRGKRAPAGVYFCQVTTSNERAVLKMILMGGGSVSQGHAARGADPGSTTSQTGRESLADDPTYSVILESIDSTSPPFETTRIMNLSIPANDMDLDFRVTELVDFSLCYERPAGGVGQIFLNNLKGTHPLNISNYTIRSDEYPKWSPDGRYIAFRRNVPLYGPLTFTYDLEHSTYSNLTSDGGRSRSLPQWTPNGMVCFAYERPVSTPPATYVMNADGTGKKRILDTVASKIWFYSDSNRFLFVQHAKVYLSDIERSSCGLIADLSVVFGQEIVVQDFDPIRENLLFTYVSIPDSIEWIATYNVKTLNSTNLLSPPLGYSFTQLRYSTDCQKIALIEHSEQDEYLSILSNGTKERLVRIPKSEPWRFFSYEPITFSLDDRLIAYSDMVFGNGQYVNFVQHLYTVDILTKVQQLIDVGWYPSWSPR